jgi:hypothetical protein
MAKTQVNIGMFERAGRASGQANLSEAGYKAPYDYSKGFTNSMKRASEATAAAKKTADLLKKNPNGVEIPKLTEALSDKTAAWLSGKKDEIGRMHELMTNGSDEEKKEAVDYLNNIDKGVRQLNSDFEGAAAKQAEYLSIANNGTHAVSNSSEQSKNFNDFANGDFAQQGEIVEDENGFPRLNYNGQVWDTVDVGSEYNFKLEDTVDGFLTDIEKLGMDGKQWNRDATRRQLEVLAREPDKVKDYIYQNEELLDAYISNQTGILQTINGEPNPAWKDFKAGIGNKMPRIGDVGPQEDRKMMYDDYKELNKEDVKFAPDFVDLVMQTFQDKYDNPPKSSDQVSGGNAIKIDF